MIQNPCYRDCPDRHSHCHVDCSAYKLWKLEQQAVAEKVRISKVIDNYMISSVERRADEKRER